MVVVKHDVLRRLVRGILTRTEMREKCYYYYFKSQRACCNSILNQNSCVLLQTEAADLMWISSQRPVERHTESGWNLQAIGLCACVVLGRKEGPCDSGWNLQAIGLL